MSEVEGIVSVSTKRNEEFAISIVVPIHALNYELEQCLRSIHDYSSGIYEVILVLDGFEADRHFFDQFHLVKIQIVQLKKNSGPAAARNHGASVAQGNILFFIDSDVCIKPDTISRVLSNFDQSHSPNAVIGSYDNAPQDQALVSRYRNLLHHYTHQQASESASTFWGACGAIKKKTFEEVGGFDICFEKPSVEDIDLGYRLIQKGFRIRLDKDLQVKHLKKWVLSQMIKTDVFYRAKSWTELLYKNRKWQVSDLNVDYKERWAVILLCLGIGSLVFGLVVPTMLATAVLFFFLVLLLKRKTYLFFLIHFPLRFPLVILLHWMYLLCAVSGLALGTMAFLVSKFKKKGNEIGKMLVLENCEEVD